MSAGPGVVSSHGTIGEGRCARCHSDALAAGTSHRIGCTLCHDGHARPKPPNATCKSCHGGIAVRLGHESHANAACTRCHTVHGPSQVRRPTCLACHEDRANHFPDAPFCQACHPFSS